MGNFTLKLYSESTLKTHSFQTTDYSTDNDFYIFDCDFSNVEDGEYKYFIEVEHIIVASGLILIGVNYIDDRKEHTKIYNEDNEYIVYGE